MGAELESIDGGWRKLAWVAGALPLVWSFRKSGRTQIAVGLIGGSPMEQIMTAQSPGWRATLKRNLAVFFACYLGAVVVVSLTVGATLLLGGKVLSVPVELVLVAVYAVCSIVSTSRGAVGAACVFAGLAVTFAVEFGYYNTVGNFAFPNVSSQVANMSIAILCVSAGAVISRRAALAAR